MWKRVCLVILFCILCVSARPFPAQKRETYTGPLLTSCSLYQIGTDEFLLTLNGKKLPEPTAETDDNILLITFDGARAQDADAINSQISDILDTIPMLYDFELEQLSDDKAVVRLDASAPLIIDSAARTASGFTFRVKSTGVQASIMPGISLPPPNTANLVDAPTTSLPFTDDTRTTIEFRDAELQDVFRLFMAALGRNIVLDASFPKGVLVTMTLVDVRIDEIMNFMLKTYDLACYNYGPNITAFGTRAGLYKLTGAREIRSFRIAYAEPAQVSSMLATLAGVSGNEVVIDERMRTLYVNTNPAKMQEVADMISKLDTPLQQVMIKASIFEFSDSATRDVQNSLNMVYDKWTLISNPASGSGTLSYIDRTYSQGRSALDRYITNTLSALESKNKGHIVANPSVIAIDGQAATISLRQTINYIKGRDQNGNVTRDEMDVGPQLNFTPRVEDNGYVNLQVSITTGDFLGSDGDNIITTNRTVNTRIRVRDGMPFVIGGLFQDTNTRAKSKLPVLGDLPLLGSLFQYNQTNKNKSQVVMIVTPYILDSH